MNCGELKARSARLCYMAYMLMTTGAWTIIRAVVICLIAVLWYEVSAERAAQVAGVALLVQASMFLIQRRVPYGWRGAPPSGFITGPSAVLLALLLCGIGIGMVLYPGVPAALFDRAR